MSTFQVPTKEQVSQDNQKIFDNLQSQLGFVPNLYATYAYSDNALKNYLALASAKTSLSNREKEVINLAVSQANNCLYCLSAHTAIAQSNGFSKDEILELRSGTLSNNDKYAALAALAKSIAENRGNASADSIENFFEAGYTNENLIDTIVQVGDKTISNYLHNLTQIPVDFPQAQPLEAELA